MVYERLKKQGGGGGFTYEPDPEKSGMAAFTRGVASLGSALGGGLDKVTNVVTLGTVPALTRGTSVKLAEGADARNMFA